MPTVVKHSYLKGRSRNSKAMAHIKYIMYRHDEKDRSDELSQPELNDEESLRRSVEDDSAERQDLPGEKAESQAAEEFLQDNAGQSRRDPNTGKVVKGKARPMFDQDGKRVFARDVQKQIKQLGRNDVVHKLILSPGHNTVDMHKYTHEVLEKLGQQKGQDLNYYFVIHENTDHIHAHVVLIGRDQEGGLVRLFRDDHTRIRAFGDRYMEREHGIELRADKDLERFAREHGLNLQFERDEARLYELLEKPKSVEKQRDLDDFFRHDENARKLLEEPQYEGHARLGRSTYHLIGEQADLKQIFDNNQQRHKWTDILDNQPDRREEAEKMLADLAEQRTEIFNAINERTQSRDVWGTIENVNRELEQESLELQAILRGYEPREWENEDIDIESVKPEDKFELENGQVVTKFHDSEFLKSIQQGVRDFALDKLPFDDFRKLDWWISTKEFRGEDCYGTPPLVEKKLADDREEPEPTLNLDALSKELRTEEASLANLLDGARDKEEATTSLPKMRIDEQELEKLEADVDQFDRTIEGRDNELSRDDSIDRVDDAQTQIEQESAGQGVFSEQNISEPQERKRERGDDDGSGLGG